MNKRKKIKKNERNRRNMRFKKILHYINLILQIYLAIATAVAPTYNYSCIEIKTTHININLYYIKN